MVQYVCERCGRNWYTAMTPSEDVGRCQDCGGPLCPAAELFKEKEGRDADDTSLPWPPPSQ